uniref:Uncharacterized protein n=1 Tax=Musa acuminata subsp. malaccensis TaxID=214687 RepID=A0A804JL95_MUSAM
MHIHERAKVAHLLHAFWKVQVAVAKP